MDKNEKRRKRYAEMTDSLKKELLQNRREKYAAKKAREKDMIEHHQSELDNNIKENALILEPENLDSLSKMSVVHDEPSFFMPSPSHLSPTIDKNEERRKKYKEMPESMKQQLLKKRREKYASKRAQEKIGVTDYKSSISKAMETYKRKHMNYLLRKRKKQLEIETSYSSININDTNEVEPIDSGKDEEEIDLEIAGIACLTMATTIEETRHLTVYGRRCST